MRELDDLYLKLAMEESMAIKCAQVIERIAKKEAEHFKTAERLKKMIVEKGAQA